MKEKITFFSLLLNLSLIGLFIAKSAKPLPNKEIKLNIAQVQSIKNVIDRYLDISFLELVLELKNETHIENGIKHQDLALSLLSSRFDFDIQKILDNPSTVRIEYPNPATKEIQTLELFEPVQKAHFDALLQFGLKEKYPFRSKKLFAKIKSCEYDALLLHAFYLTKEFEWIKSVFAPLSKTEVLQMCLEVDFSLIEDLYSTYHAQEMGDLFIQVAYTLAFDGNSMHAANILLDYHFDFITHHFSDEQLICLMSLLSKKTRKLKDFVEATIQQKRSSKVKSMALALLFHYYGLEIPKPFEFENARTVLKTKGLLQ
jgi:hypothetical protein